MTVISFAGEPTTDIKIITELMSMAKRTRAILRLRLADLGLATGEDDILLGIPSEGNCSVEDLSRTLSVRAPTIERSIDSLVGRGYVERLAGPIVKLSTSGTATATRIGHMQAEIVRDLRAELGKGFVEDVATDLATLNGGLAKLLSSV